MKRDKGIALLLAIGILTVLALIATSFALTMRMEYKTSVAYHDGIKARYGAEAALHKAISDLKDDIKVGAFDNLSESWANTGINQTINVGGDNVQIIGEIVDEQRKININYAGESLIADLITVLTTYGNNNPGSGDPTRGAATYSSLDAAGDAEAIFERRPAGGYQSVWHVVSISENSYEDDGYNNIDSAIMTLLAPFITTHSFGISGGDAYRHININTADKTIIAAVLMDGVNFDVSTAWQAAGGLTANRPYGAWWKFNDSCDEMADTGYGGVLNQGQADSIKTLNPNNSSGIIFGFNSGGYYGITAKGRVLKNGSQVAEQSLFAIVRLYDIEYYTSEGYFGSVLYDDDADFDKVTWKDQASIVWDLSFNWGTTRSGSVKLGYYDDFENPILSRKAFGNDSIPVADIDSSGDKELFTNGDSYSLKWSHGDHKLKVDQDYYSQLPNGSDSQGGMIRLWGNPNAELTVSHAMYKSGGSGGGYGSSPRIRHPFINTGYGGPDPWVWYESAYGYYDKDVSATTTTAGGVSQEEVTFLPTSDYTWPTNVYHLDEYCDEKIFGSWQAYHDTADKSDYYPRYFRLWPNSDLKRNCEYTSWEWNSACPQPTEYIQMITQTGASDPIRESQFKISAPEVGDTWMLVDGALFSPDNKRSWENNIPTPRNGSTTFGGNIPTAWDNLQIGYSEGYYLSEKINLSYPCSFTGTYYTHNSKLPYDIIVQTSLNGFNDELDDILNPLPWPYGYEVSASISLREETPEVIFQGNPASVSDFQYKAFFKGSPINLDSTPALDDITITTMPPNIEKIFSYHMFPPD